MTNIFAKDIIGDKHKKDFKDIQVFDDELTVVDIDLTTLRINDVTDDGYIIDELGNVKRLSDETILFIRKIYSKNDIAKNRFVSKRNYLDDEIKVSDIDLSTIELKNIHKDGYYISKDGNVHKISDEAILFLRRMFPKNIIAENRLPYVNNYKEDLINVEDIDLSTINLKNINMSGYYLNEDTGIVRRLSDDAILFLRKIYKNNKIAIDRVCEEKEIKLVRDNKGKELLSKVKNGSKVVTDTLLSGISNLKTNVSSKALSLKDTVLEKKKIVGQKIKSGKDYLTENKSKITKGTESLVNGVKNLFVNAKNCFGSLKKKIILAKNSERFRVKDGINKISEKKDSILTSIKNLKTNINSKLLNLKKKFIIVKTKIFGNKVKDDLLELQNSVSKVKVNDLREKSSLTNKISELRVNLASRLFRLKNRIKLSHKPVYARNVCYQMPKRVFKDGVKPNELIKESLSDKISNLKINLKSKYFDYKRASEYNRRALYAKNIKKVKPERIFKEGLRPEELKNKSLSDKISNLKYNVSNKVNNINKRIELSRKPTFAKNAFIGDTSGLRDFKTGIRPEKNMGDLNMLERVTTYIKNIGKPNYAIKVQRLDNNVRKYQLVKEPLFKSSYILSNLKVVGRKLTGIGGVVALTSSMMSSIAPSTTATADNTLYDKENVAIFKEIEDNRYSGIVNLDDEDDDYTYIQGILLDEHADKSLANKVVAYTDDYYDIDPLSYSNDDGEELAASMTFGYAEEETVDDSIYFEPDTGNKHVEEELCFEHTESEVNNESNQKLSFGVEEYVNYAKYNSPYTELHLLDESLTKDIIDKYSKIYNVSYSVVYNKIAELTDNFTNDDYINEKTISGVTCKGKQVYANSYEELLMLAVRSIAQLPSRFNINYNDLHNCSYYVSSDDYASQISHIAKLFNIDRCLVYAIIHTETNFVSDLFLKRNNPAGLMDNAKYCTFSSKEEGFIELCTEIRKYNERGAYTLEEMAQIHCEGNPKWAPTVREVYETVKSKEREIFCDDELVLDKTR